MASIVSLSTATTNSVVFPPPPPTTNALTPEQRSQLRKSTKKLGKILGTTPHLLDTDIVSILGPVHVQLPPRYEAPSPVFSDSSTDSYTSRSSSSCSYYSHPYSARASLERKLSTSSSFSRQNSLRTRSSTDRFDRLNSADALAPVLRLTLTPPSPSTTSSSSFSSSSSSSPTSSPSKTSAKFSLINPHSRSNSLDDFFTTTNSSSDMKFTLRPARHSTSTQSCNGSISEEPSFNAPSSTATITTTSRRQKMDRLRKMLGDEVPVHLVFPDQDQGANFRKGRDFININEEEGDDDDDTSNDNDHRLFGLTPVAVAGTAIPRPKKKSTAGKIVATRDSMGAFTPHRAKRQGKQKPEKLPTMSSPPPPRAPSPPIVIPASCILPQDKSQKKLCAIVESPEEHGSNPFEGFGFGCPGPKRSSVVVQSSWHVHNSSINGDSAPEDMNKVWSTRKGYTGWDRSTKTTLGKSQEERKRAMSYRKPPPSIDF